MKVIIAGGRYYTVTLADATELDKLNITEVVSGGCTGADRGGEIYAELRNIPIRVFKADWKKYCLSAGPIRNRQMAEYADAVVLFPGGRGTSSMYREARKACIEIYDYR